MTANLKPYPSMKDSGIEALGKVPAHWDVPRLRNVTEMRVSNVDKHSRQNEDEVRLCNYVDVYKNDRIRAGMPLMRATATADEIERFSLRSGDVLITKDSEVWNDIGVPALVEETEETNPRVVSGYHLALLRPYPERTDSGYLFRSLQSTAIASQLHVQANGVTRFGLTRGAIKAVRMPLPPLREQASIVRFLDHADRHIHHYIRSRKKLIALLAEQKQAIIHEAVTGQIDIRTGLSFPAYKPSDVEWIGIVPEKWVVSSLRHRYLQCLGKMLDSNRITKDHLLPYLRNIDVQWDRINIDNLPQMDITPDEYGRYTVKRGDLLVCEGGEVGRCALWSDELSLCGFQKALHRLRPRDTRQDVPRFMYYVLRAAAYSNAFTDGHVSTIPHLTGDKLRAHRFPFPPFSGQKMIVCYLDRVTKAIDTATHRFRRQVTLLEEYRELLIDEVVTGKVDVRNGTQRYAGA